MVLVAFFEPHLIIRSVVAVAEVIGLMCGFALFQRPASAAAVRRNLLCSPLKELNQMKSKCNEPT